MVGLWSPVAEMKNKSRTRQRVKTVEDSTPATAADTNTGNKNIKQEKEDIKMPPQNGQSSGPVQSRRTHTKSRKGCQTCKNRHIRCDETAPQW
jgi:hypothetical protein